MWQKDGQISTKKKGNGMKNHQRLVLYRCQSDFCGVVLLLPEAEDDKKGPSVCPVCEADSPIAFGMFADPKVLNYYDEPYRAEPFRGLVLEALFPGSVPDGKVSTMGSGMAIGEIIRLKKVAKKYQKLVNELNKAAVAIDKQVEP
jgi:hypothetical protein